jgi:hypothetical protein
MITWRKTVRLIALITASAALAAFGTALIKWSDEALS